MIIWLESSVAIKLWGTIWRIWLVAIEAETLIVNFSAAQTSFFDVQRKKESQNSGTESLHWSYVHLKDSAVALISFVSFLHLAQMELKKYSKGFGLKRQKYWVFLLSSFGKTNLDLFHQEKSAVGFFFVSLVGWLFFFLVMTQSC